MKIYCVYDNPNIVDRYTIIFKEYLIKDDEEYYFCVSMNHQPKHPQGFCLHDNCLLNRHLGKRILFNSLEKQQCYKCCTYWNL